MVLDRGTCKVRKINEVPNAIVMLLQTQRHQRRVGILLQQSAGLQQNKLPVCDSLEL